MTHPAYRRVLVTGGQGALGQRVQEAFGGGGSETWAPASRELDVTDLAALRTGAHDYAPDLVVNCAAYTNVDGCETERDRAFRVNGVGAGHVAQVTAELGIPLLHVSTDYIFDGAKAEAYVECDLPAPLSVYGWSKWWGEDAVRQLNPRHFVVRTQWLYGRGGRNFVDSMLQQARERSQLRVVDDQFGCPTRTDDLAKELKRIVEKGGYGTWHASSGGSCSWFRFTEEIVKTAGVAGVEVVPITSQELKRPAKRPANGVLRNLRLEVTIGDHMPPWQESLRAYLAQPRE